jgi:hypothetical protein
MFQRGGRIGIFKDRCVIKIREPGGWGYYILWGIILRLEPLAKVPHSSGESESKAASTVNLVRMAGSCVADKVVLDVQITCFTLEMISFQTGLRVYLIVCNLVLLAR